MRTAAFAAILAAFGAPVLADELFYVSGAVGNAVENFAKYVKPWEEKTGNKVTLVPMPASTTDQFAQYRLWLAAGSSEIDVFQTDVIWAPQLADSFVDLTEAAKDLIPQEFPSIIQSQTVNGKLVALPIFTDAPALYYRKDLLEKYGVAVPTTWDELTVAAQKIQDGEKADHPDFWGYVWQGNSYEGLTCDALEWVKSFGGGQIVEPDGTVSINNPKAVKALETAKGWVGTISPPGVLAYGEEDSRGVWQTGNAAFMRNWPYAYALGDGEGSAVKGLFGVTTLPVGAAGDAPAATLGGWNVAVSKYSKHQEAAISLALYLASPEVQKMRALNETNLPTLVALYDDPEIAAKAPIIPQWKNVFLNAVPRPSAPTLGKYSEVSSKFFNAVHETLSGNGSAADNLAALEADLNDLKGDAW
ncbi:MAG: ABC transporter substrate-binding protein [Pseudorhodobacter sp.]|nr:ABC transporter substrate-binding protein [Pseudorhodobacter sp.]